jgi:16S rRNA (guanine(966)-N(2))-methyltransferase RsmD
VNFLKAPVQPDEYEKPQPVTEEMVPSAPATTPSEIPPVETVEPVYQTPAAPLTYQSVGQPALSQVEEVYASQIMAGARYSLSAAQVLGLFPSGTRVQYLKLKSGKISFLIYVAEEAEGQRIKTGIGNLPGIQASEVFYIERMPTVAAPNVQIMAILKLRLDSGTPRSIRFQNDVNLSQVLWSIGKRNNLNLQPLGIAEPPAAKPRLAEIRGDGGVNSIANFLQELANIDLNLGIEQVSLTPASDATGYSGFFNLRSIPLFTRKRCRMVRVISGSLKNRSIYYGKILAIRPTQDRVKSAMFSIIGELGGCKVADLFAGTGNLGIEALSRGATSCTFVEIESHNSALIRQNLLTLGLEKDTEIVRTDVLSVLADMPQFDLILADPPYQYAHYSELLRSFSR